MPITDEEKKAKIFMIYGVPDKDTAFGELGLVTISGPVGEIFTIKDIRDRINAALAATNAGEDKIIDTNTPSILKEFDQVFLAEQEVFQDNGSQGVLFSVSARMEILRKRISDILGVYVPRGGFMRAFEEIVKSGRRSAGPSR